MFGRRKAKQERGEMGPAGVPWLAYPEPQWPEPAQGAPEPAPAAAVVDDFLPPDFRMDTDDELAGRFMPWRRPLVVDGEVRACPQCQAYRDWVILCTQGRIWLRCRDGHETLEPRLDVAWYNRNSGPSNGKFGTLEEGLRSLDH
ncbi:hypothetical protein GCM10010215_25260 [Streptomyces virginiae]|uniref:Uncharacterized protein n=1 Tax=Streptomyces virginiae TaxID=1961 RepID=A0ABQ3NNE7_STRVG|nr:hypothetical protein [Streptomyces virginiae]MBP2341836.1 hypothetical protein [Streptomyces virginiae]GGP98536.1 hypothetical protein GCM10010215_25260 [Streptomyces virginiae]GHI14295.1 hypothetical protein Scinn_37580 [Streptomyces virginiae]